NADIKSENIKLKQGKEESDKEKTSLIVKLERDVSLIKGQSLQDKGTACCQTVANVSQALITVSPEISSNHIPKQMILRNEDAPASDVSDNASKSDLHQPICIESKSSEELLSTPENATNISHKQSIKSQISTTHSNNVSISEAEKMASNHNEDPNIADARLSPGIHDISSKIPYNQKVEQGLIRELFKFIRGTDFISLQNLKKTPLNSIFIKQISDIPVDIDLTPGSAPHLAHLFGKAEKTGRKEKLRWYYYSEEYEKKVSNLSSEKNISDQMARTQIYDEMMQYLPGIKRVFAVDAISSLTGTQIQNIINLYTKEFDAKVLSFESQKLIGVKNSSPTCDQQKTKAFEETLPETEVSTITTSSIPLSHTSILEGTVKDDVKSLPEVRILPIDKNSFNESRLPISILPNDPEEKRNLVIHTTLEQFNNLSLKRSNKYSDYYDYSGT
ncbi:3284_t:CDS:2, partial [Cetraspora pellucida]